MGETIDFPAGGSTGAGAGAGAAARAAGAAGTATAACSEPPFEGLAEIRTERPPAFSSSSPMPVLWTRLMRRSSSWSWKPATTWSAFSAGGVSAPAAAALGGLGALRPARARFSRSAPRGMRPQAFAQPAQGEPIAVRSEPRHARHHHAGHQRAVAERFPCVRVRHVHLDRREARAHDRVADRDARMREAARVEDHTVTAAASLVQGVDENALVRALERLDLATELTRKCNEARVHIFQRHAAVDFRLACSERLEVGSVQDEDAEHRGRLQARDVLAPAKASAARTSRDSTARGTLASPMRVVNTQRTAPLARFLSCCMALSRRSTETRGIRAGSPRWSSAASSRTCDSGARPATRTESQAAARMPIATASPWSSRR